MIALLSPAKTLDWKRPLPDVAPTRPRFAEEADGLAAAAAKLGPKKLAALMHISPKLAKLNAERYRGFGDAPERPALYAFMGDVYIGFAARGLGADAIAFAQEHVRILSGLYGLLRPLDTIRPYRLEMGTAWAPGRKKDLYAFWGDRIGEALAEDLAAQGTAAQDSGVIINLASREYWAVVAQSPPKGARIISIDFRDTKPDGELFFNSFNAKRARGAMARHICAEKIDKPGALKDAVVLGYAYDKAGSDDATWRFLKR